jgi:hypothetical protein
MIRLRLAVPAVLVAAAFADCLTYFVVPLTQADTDQRLPATMPTLTARIEPSASDIGQHLAAASRPTEPPRQSEPSRQIAKPSGSRYQEPTEWCLKSLPQSRCPILRGRMAEQSIEDRERYVGYATHSLQLARWRPI